MAYKDPSDPRLLEKRREHYRKNKEIYIARTREREKQMKEYVIGLKNNPCLDCEVEYPNEPWLMEFDHRTGSDKVGDIAKIVKSGSWKKLYAEIDKCDLLCVVCHRRRTAIRGEWGDREVTLHLLN